MFKMLGHLALGGLKCVGAVALVVGGELIEQISGETDRRKEERDDHVAKALADGTLCCAHCSKQLTVDMKMYYKYPNAHSDEVLCRDCYQENEAGCGG